MRTETTRATSIHKVRRRALGNKRARGHEFQRQGRRVRRLAPEAIRRGPVDKSLSGVGGLAPFGRYARRIGLDRQLHGLFGELKTGRKVVYPMGTQLRLLVDANVVGEDRVFGVEMLGADPLFLALAGGSVPSIDTLYRDLCRFEATDLAKLEVLMAYHGIEEVGSRQLDVVHLDIDTTVEPLFGTQEGALPGYNPRYHGQPSYHPLLAVVAETGTCVGARLRPGDRNFGDADAKDIRAYVDRARAAVGSDARLVVRIDGAADCTEILEQIHDAGAHFLVKARLTPELLGALVATKQWTTVDWDADGQAVRQVAEIRFAREEWKRRSLPVRVIAVRSTEHDVGKQTMLWPELDYAVQVYLASDKDTAIEDLAIEYNGRAEIEPTIAELKGALGLGKVPSQSFNANHAAFLIKLLSHNLVKRYVRAVAPEAATWRLPWLRRALFTVPARFVRSARRWSIRVPPHSTLHAVMCRLE